MNCLNCNKITPIWGKKHKKYCNTLCLRQYDNITSKKIFTEISCHNCSSLFLPKSKLVKFCSLNCKRNHERDKAKKNLPLKKCSICDKDFKPYTSLDKFCSYQCRIKNVKSKRKYNHTEKTCINRSGKNNPSYVHGMAVRGVKLDSTGIRLFHKNRDSYKKNIIDKHGFLFCEICNKSNVRFETHHIVYRSEKPKHEFLHDKINLILVCVPCHNWFHNKKGNRNEIVQIRQLQNYFGNDILDK
jgi:hypothetical protein